jgi:hypothetical protein
MPQGRSSGSTRKKVRRKDTMDQKSKSKHEDTSNGD